MDLNQFIRVVPDFPKPGISFKDITPLLLDAQAREVCLKQLVAPLKDLRATKVVGVEARGFFFGMAIARELGIGFVPVRKPGKLPFETVAQSYDLEYGTDTLEIHSDAIKPGDRVILHDDVLATGGTAAASCELIQKLGGKVVACSFLMELSFLNGHEKLSGQTVHRVLSY
ncbi:adenine phosphoribosyltransferase [Gilvibacter sp.]|uniref:adenine phosphoribosyltransferase n=1 Tax=Gilvibacter sp. TaxID=2729997 RepID=UPI003F49CE8D